MQNDKVEQKESDFLMDVMQRSIGEFIDRMPVQGIRSYYERNKSKSLVTTKIELYPPDWLDLNPSETLKSIVWWPFYLHDILMDLDGYEGCYIKPAVAALWNWIALKCEPVCLTNIHVKIGIDEHTLDHNAAVPYIRMTAVCTYKEFNPDEANEELGGLLNLINRGSELING